MLLLDNKNVQQVFDIQTCLQALEHAYIAQSHNELVMRLQTQTYVPRLEPEVSYCLKTMEASLPASGHMVLRLTSDVVSEAMVNNVPRRKKLPRGPGGTYCGLIVLFSLDNLAPIALLHDGYIQLYRVACTSALATRLLAREDATDVALIGSGKHAWAHLVAMQHVRKLKRVRVFSPNAGRCREFTIRVRDQLGLEADNVRDPQQAVDGADIVVAATNSSVPVVMGRWLAPGAHVVSIVTGDEKTQRRELDDEVFKRAGTVIVHSKESAAQQRHGDVVGPVEAGILDWGQLHDLSALIAGDTPGRKSADEITVFKNNVGLGLQFAAVATRVYLNAREAGIGRELPDEWFVQEMAS